MSRHDEAKGGSSNPAVKWLEWSSDSKCFKYYDKEAQQQVEVKLPLSFIFLKQMHTIRGWDGATESRIYSNEIATMKQEFSVKSYKGGNLVSGFWKDIKAKATALGGKYHRSIYIMVENGEVWNIQLKGSAVKEWYDFFDENKKNITKHEITVSGFSSHKNGSIKYTTPQFSIDTDKNIDSGLDEKAEEVYVTLNMYLKAYEDGKELEKESERQEVGVSQADDDDLPF